MAKPPWMSWEDNRAVKPAFHRDDHPPSAGGDPDGARAACSGGSALMVEFVIGELVRRVLFAEDNAASKQPSRDVVPSRRMRELPHSNESCPGER